MTASSKASPIPLFKVHLPDRINLMPRLEDTLYSGMVSEGEQVRRFEGEFLARFRFQRGFSVNSCTSALHLALILAGVSKGDEVISTPVTTEPTNVAILQSGAQIVWADVDPMNGNLCANSIKAASSARTKAVMLVHYAGIPAPLSEIRDLCVELGVPLIEDCAHALGARYDGAYIGASSDFAAFSFQAIKHMTTIDGGFLLCGNEIDVQRGKRLRWFGIDRALPRDRAEITEVGYKYHMNNVNAAIGLSQLPEISAIIERYRDNGRYFDKHLAGTPGLELCRWEERAEPAYWLYTVLAENRSGLEKKLNENGIAAAQVITRNDRHPVFPKSASPLYGVEEYMKKMLHIPCGWWLDDEDRERLCDVIRAGW